MGSVVTLILGGIAFIVAIAVTVKLGLKYQKSKKESKTKTTPKVGGSSSEGKLF